MVALGGAADEVLDRVELGRAEPLVVEGWAAGMGHVLASALAQAGGDWEAVVVLLGDQPLVTGRAVARVVEAWRAGAGPVVTATYGGRPGHPKLFDRRLLPDLLRLTGDTGARDLVAAHPDRVHRVEVGDLGSDADIDVEADLERVGRTLTTQREGAMRIENTVEVDAPLDRVWALVNDIPRVAPCMPGAALTGVLDDDTYEGTVAVKLGPLRMSYKGKVVVEDVDEANHSARLAATGKDVKGAGTARASVETRLEAVGDNHTRLHVTSDVQLTGKVASFGRGGAINDVATRLFGQFADCLRATLESDASPSGFGGTGAGAAAAATGPPARQRPRRRPPPGLRPGSLRPGSLPGARPGRPSRLRPG